MKVEPDASRFAVLLDGDFPCLKLTAPAEQGRANDELTRRLTEIFGEKTGIVSGHHSRRKKIAVDLDRDTVMERLEAAARQYADDR